MTYESYGKIVGYSAAAICKNMNKKKGKMKPSVAIRLSEGGFLSSYDWKYLTPAQRKRKWREWVSEHEDKELTR